MSEGHVEETKHFNLVDVDGRKLATNIESKSQCASTKNSLSVSLLRSLQNK